MEVSERERARRKLERAQRRPNEVAAQSFRLGSEHIEKLKKLAQRSDVAQVDMIRQMIDREWTRVNKLRKQREVN